ncbi:hypothetical protein PMAYCL1PPCAC_33350, partial [Pristionchus mayeri]
SQSVDRGNSLIHKVEDSLSGSVMVLRLAALLLLLLFSSLSEATQLCFSCSIYEFHQARTRCSNPSVCEGDVCYTFISSTGSPMMLAGCISNKSKLPKLNDNSRFFCHALGPTAICFCPGLKVDESPTNGTTMSPYRKPQLELCNRYYNSSNLAGNLVKPHEFEHIIMETTGIDSYYIRKRYRDMNFGEIPETFQGEIVNGVSLPSFLLLSFLLLLSL